MNGECRKCGGNRIGGPYYRHSHSGWHGYELGERLVYQCMRCGYEWSTPTRDAEPAQPERKPGP